MSLTIEIMGTVEAGVLASAPATLTIELGTPGPAATIAAGTTTTLSPGSSATVTNAGSSSAATFNFGIPAGATGATGATGVIAATSPLAYNSGTQTVSINLSAYLAKADNLAGLASTSTSRTNLGLGTMAVATAADYSTTSVANALYYPLTGNPSGFLTSAPVTSVAGYTGAVTLANTDISGFGTLSVVNDAPSNGTPYVRKDAAWEQLIIT